MKDKLAVLILVSSMLLVPAAASTLSISEIDYSSNSDFYSEGHVQVQFLLDGTGETVTAEIPSEELNPKIDGQTSKDLQISGDLQSVQAEYSIDDRNLPNIEDIEYVRESFSNKDTAINWAETNCIDPENDGTVNYEYYSNFRLLGWEHFVNCAVVDRNEPVYNVGFIQSPPDTTMVSKWTVNADGESPESAVISNNGVGSGSSERIGDHSQIEFISLRDLGSQAPNPQNSLAVYSSQTGWKIANEEHIQDYRDYMKNQVPDNIEEMPDLNDLEGGELDQFQDEKEGEVQDFFTDATSEYSESSIAGANDPTVEAANMEEGVFTYSPSSQFEWFVSEFLIRIDGAEYLEIEKPLAEPEIVEVVSGAEVTDIKSGVAEIRVQNQGNGPGSFEGFAQCSDPSITSTGTATSKSVEPGEIVSFYPKISGSSGENFETQCTFNVEDLETSEQVSTSFDVEFTQSKECTPGEMFVAVENGQEVIYECADNGVDWQTVEECGTDETAEAAGKGYECVKIEDPDIGDGGTGNCEVNLTEAIGLNPLLGEIVVKNPICLIQQQLSSLGTAIGMLNFILDLIFVVGAGLVGWLVGNTAVAYPLSFSPVTDNPKVKNIAAGLTALVFIVAMFTIMTTWWLQLLFLIGLIVALYFAAPFLIEYGAAKAL